MATALSKEGYFGFGLQSVKGSYVSPDNWLPLMDWGSRRADTVQLQNNYVALDLADSQDYQSKYFSAGQWAEGSLRFPLIPGMLTDLLAWIQDRDDDNQGMWASALIDCVYEVKKLTDMKVQRARIDLVKGEPVMCSLDVAALKLEAGSATTPSIPTAAPYVFREATVELATGGGALAEDINCEKIRIVIDNLVEEPAEGMRLVSAAAPVQLYNLSGVRCWGALSRDFVDNDVYGDFASGTEAALAIELARGAVSATISLPRILYVADDLGLPGSHEKRIVEKVDFLALGSVDGETAPVILS